MYRQQNMKNLRSKENNVSAEIVNGAGTTAGAVALTV